jgi:hypothetical protein
MVVEIAKGGHDISCGEELENIYTLLGRDVKMKITTLLSCIQVSFIFVLQFPDLFHTCRYIVHRKLQRRLVLRCR